VHFSLKIRHLDAPTVLITLQSIDVVCMQSRLHWPKKWLDGVQPPGADNDRPPTL